jgi:hypothetical protein
MTHYDISGVCMAISVIFIRLNLIVYPIVCYRCWTHCNRFNASSEILSVVAEGLYFFNKTKRMHSHWVPSSQEDDSPMPHQHFVFFIRPTFPLAIGPKARILMPKHKSPIFTCM